VVVGRTPRRIYLDHIARYEFAAEILQRRPDPTVVDVGCGTGYGTALLAASSADCVGIDVAAG
jgi:protein-L-isoaspartate O-methyltransferase